MRLQTSEDFEHDVDWLYFLRGDAVGASMLVTIFLDFDGVLHPTWAKSERLFERAGLLDSAVAHLHHIEFVVSSSWAAYKDLQQLRHHFRAHPTLQQLIIDRTRQLQTPAQDLGRLPEREAQCRSWLHENGRHPGKWLAIEDDASNFTTTSNVVKTDGNVGLTYPDIQTLTAMVAALQA